MVRKIVGHDIGHIYAMKVLKKATLKGLFTVPSFLIRVSLLPCEGLYYDVLKSGFISS